MPRWKGKNDDHAEKYAKMRKRGKQQSRSKDLEEDFERPEDEWEVGGEDGAFAARVVEVHKRYAFVSSEETRGDVAMPYPGPEWVETAREERAADGPWPAHSFVTLRRAA